MQWQLAENPPADRMIQIYFAGNKWWSPPVWAGSADDVQGAEADVWVSDLPETTD